LPRLSVAQPQLVARNQHWKDREHKRLAPSAFELSLPAAGAVMRRLVTTAAACLLLGAMAACGTSQVSAHGAKLYKVPTSSWRPGDPSLLALAIGTLAAGRYRGHWCVWLVARWGSGREPIVWPAGFRARRHPLELLDSHGKVVARGGELIKIGGGLVPVSHGPCMLGQKEPFYAMGYPERMNN
jgi:hypothetical protein